MTLALLRGGYTMFDATELRNNSGHQFQTWDALFRPVQVHYNSFSHLFQVNIPDPVADLGSSSIVVSGYGENSTLAPPAFPLRKHHCIWRWALRIGMHDATTHA